MANILFRRLQDDGGEDLTAEEKLVQELGTEEDYKKSLKEVAEIPLAAVSYPRNLSAAALTNKDLKDVSPISLDKPSVSMKEVREKNPKIEGFLSALFGKSKPEAHDLYDANGKLIERVEKDTPEELKDLAGDILIDPLTYTPLVAKGVAKLSKNPKEALLPLTTEHKSFGKGGPVAGYTPDKDALNVAKKPTYHGTSANIEEYKIGPKGKPIFSSLDPKVASRYAESGSGYDAYTDADTMLNDKVYKNVVQPEKLFNPNNEQKLNELREHLMAKAKETQALAKEPNTPDFGGDENWAKRNVDDIINQLKDKDANWRTIESPTVQKALKDLGYDSFYVNEEGVRNVGVLNPDIMQQALTKSQRKEAIKNIKNKLLEPKAAKIVEAQKAYEAEMMKKIK